MTKKRKEIRPRFVNYVKSHRIYRSLCPLNAVLQEIHSFSLQHTHHVHQNSIILEVKKIKFEYRLIIYKEHNLHE